MSVQLHKESGDNLLIVRVSGSLTKDDYTLFVPEADRMIKQEHTDRILIELVDFHGWSPAAAWEDLKFAIKHYTDLDRVALVGNKKWEKWMAVICKPFTTAKVRYFPTEESGNARLWVMAA